MASVRGRRPPVRNRFRIEPIDKTHAPSRSTTARKLAHNRQIRRGLADELLQRIFSAERRAEAQCEPRTCLRAHKTPLITAVARELSMERYSVQQILRMLIERCETLETLRARRPS